MNSERGIVIGADAVHYYAKAERWQPRIEEFRRAWLESVGDRAGAHKATRLDRLWKIADYAWDHKMLAEARNSVEACRKEMDGPDKGGNAGEVKIFLGNAVTVKVE